MYDKDFVDEASVECRECEYCEESTGYTAQALQQEAQEHANETGHSLMFSVTQTFEIEPEIEVERGKKKCRKKKWQKRLTMKKS